MLYLCFMQLTQHFSLKELTVSEYAIRKGLNNSPGPDEIENMVELCRNVLEPLRELIAEPLIVTSGYRSPEVNKGIGGAKKSQHVEGKAADIHCKGFDIDSLFEICKASLRFDQCIHEFGEWVHISWNGDKNRQQSLKAIKQDGKTIYLPA